MPLSSALAAVAVDDLAVARDFYTRLLERPPDVEPMPTLAQWDLPPAGGIQVVEDVEHAGSSMLTLMVTDLDDFRSALEQRGIITDEVTTGVLSRLTQVSDPSGNTITIAEQADRPTGHGATAAQ